jgi:hypothetical protein
MIPPGVIITHNPARTGKYIGSPSIAVLPNGDYVASHDYFRANHAGSRNELVVFGSTDCGQTWEKRVELTGFWQNLFVHQGALYLMGLSKEYGAVIIRRSTDGGSTWTEPTDHSNGIILDDLAYHTAPMPMLIHDQKIWRTIEVAANPVDWAPSFHAGVMFAPLTADLLSADSWTLSTCLPGEENWLNGNFGGWLEGNVVLSPQGHLVNILRVDTPNPPEKAAIVTLSPAGDPTSFNPTTDFIDFPGVAKKFTIRYDPHSGYYWALVNPILSETNSLKPIEIRNTLALSRSIDLRTWEIRSILLAHPDPYQHGFQYVDWQFEGDDLIAVIRTAYDDSEGGADSAHNANYLTFHRFKKFRNL